MSALVASILLFVVISLALSVMGFRFWVQPQTALERVMGEVDSGQDRVGDPSLGFRDLLTRIGNMVPANPADVGVLQRRLLSAGIRNTNALRVLYGAKALLSALTTIIGGGIIFGVTNPDEMAPFQILAAAALGWSTPNFIVSRMAGKRQKMIRRGLPNALDMLVICVESGLGLDQSLMQVSKELQTAHPERPCTISANASASKRFRGWLACWCKPTNLERASRKLYGISRITYEFKCVRRRKRRQRRSASSWCFRSSFSFCRRCLWSLWARCWSA
jgi:hypothetical protein